MGTYLVVANRTAGCPELRDGLKTLQLRDPEAKCVLLVPATPARDVPGPQANRFHEAEAVAAGARAALEAEGLPVVEAFTGDGLPLRAIDDELRSNRRIYNGIIISTLPPGDSAWLGQDLPRRIERRWGLPVRHIVARSASSSVWRRGRSDLTPAGLS